jgi:WhiB family transcriptional regulator, redox-sensing transcriptional regulator
MTIDKNPEFMNLSWQDQAVCKNKSDLFFGSYNERTTAKIKREQEAKKLCDVCPVLTQCRTHARTHSEYGFWGGESEEERYTSGYKISNPTVRRRINKLNSSKD